MGTLTQRGLARIFVAGFALLAAACVLMPGKFTSALDLRKDGRFSFQYAGELVLLPLADPQKSGEAEVFTPQTCHADDGEAERKCTAVEIAEQKKQWKQSRDMSKASEAQMSTMLLGGINPDDPRAPQEFAARLRRQAGWRKVAYRGSGVYDVDFAIEGRLDHDFVFPTIEGFAMANPFVQVNRRSDGSVRVDAPGYGPSMAEAAMGGMMGAGMNPKTENRPKIDGAFTLRTDGQVLANNTDEGPVAATTGQELNWKIGETTKNPPTALIKLR